MMPALNDEPVKAHLLTRSMAIELAQKITAEHTNLKKLVGLLLSIDFDPISKKHDVL